MVVGLGLLNERVGRWVCANWRYVLAGLLAVGGGSHHLGQHAMHIRSDTYGTLQESNNIWAHIDKTPVTGMQQESGQLLIDKQQHWKPLLLALYMNLESSFYYTMLQVHTPLPSMQP